MLPHPRATRALLPNDGSTRRHFYHSHVLSIYTSLPILTLPLSSILERLRSQPLTFDIVLPPLLVIWFGRRQPYLTALERAPAQNSYTSTQLCGRDRQRRMGICPQRVIRVRERIDRLNSTKRLQSIYQIHRSDLSLPQPSYEQLRLCRLCRCLHRHLPCCLLRALLHDDDCKKTRLQYRKI